MRQRYNESVTHFFPLSWRVYCVLCSCLIIASCTPTRIIAPLGDGVKQLSLSAGGPALSAGGNIPLPLISVTYAQGISDNITAFGGLHLISAVFKTVHVDVGTNIGFIKPDGWRPGLSASVIANLMLGLRKGAFRLYPEITAISYWERKRSRPYLALDTWFDPTNGKQTGTNNKWAIFNVAVGHQLLFDSWSLDAEIKYGGLNIDKVLVNEIQAISINNRGSLAAFLGASWKLGGDD